MRTYNSGYFVLGAVLVALFCGCSDDGGPASPAPDYLNIAGLWSGTGQVASMAPTNHPLVQTILPLAGGSSPMTLSVQQNGQNITARLTWTGSGVYTDYSGTVGSSSLTLSWTYSNAAIVTGIMCNDGIARDMVRVGDTINGVINGNAITGTGAETDNCLITATQVADGVITITGTFSLTKSK